ncbi:MAG: hypothetical protein Q8942_17325 [Bacillota bacterium]|nr:hypothetical protein [Bacillota bacterium]
MNNYSIRNEHVTSKWTLLCVIIGWICAILSLFVVPYAFGVLGVVMGVIVSKNGSRLGLPIIIMSIILMGIGLLFSGVIMNYTSHYLFRSR